MATSPSTIDYLMDQMSSLHDVRYRKMFGEYALYLGDKVVALVCDDTLFVKPTDAGRAFAGDRVAEGLPYPGAKPYLEVSQDWIEDRDWLCELLTVTARALPPPKPKKAAKKRSGTSLPAAKKKRG